MEGKDGVLSISIGHCFPYGDVPELSGRILAIADNDKALADRLCFDSGPGSTFPLRVGGKTGPASGAPIDAEVTVIGLRRDCRQSFGGMQVPLGDCAAIAIGGVAVVLISNRTQALGLELFRNRSEERRVGKEC